MVLFCSFSGISHASVTLVQGPEVFNTREICAFYLSFLLLEHVRVLEFSPGLDFKIYF